MHLTTVSKSAQVAVAPTRQQLLFPSTQAMVAYRGFADYPEHTRVTLPALSPTMEFGTVTTGEVKEGHPEDAAAERGAAQPDGGPLHGDRDAQGEPHQRPPHDRHRRTDQTALLGLRHH